MRPRRNNDCPRVCTHDVTSYYLVVIILSVIYYLAVGLQIGRAKHRLINLKKKKKEEQQPSTIRNVGEKALFFFSLIFCKKVFIWTLVKYRVVKMNFNYY